MKREESRPEKAAPLRMEMICITSSRRIELHTHTKVLLPVGGEKEVLPTLPSGQ